MDLLVEDGTLYEPFAQPLPDAAVWVRDGRVAFVGPRAELPSQARRAPAIDARGGIIAPGFVDIHVHGGGGADTMDASVEALRRMSVAHARAGTTALVCTTVTAPQQNLLRAVRSAKEARAVFGRTGPAPEGWGARIAGVHLEGPYLNPRRKGAQNPEHMRDPSLQELAELLEAAGASPAGEAGNGSSTGRQGDGPSTGKAAGGPPTGAPDDGPPLICLVTLAPERHGALDAIRWLRQRGVAVALGHSAADERLATEAIEAGAGQVTHLFNGMSPFHHRDPGLAGVGLSDERVVAQVIADGIHVHPVALRVALRARGPAGVALITDALAPMGLGEGRFRLGGLEVEVKDGACRLLDGTLAGSIIGLADAVRLMVHKAGATLGEAVAMASRVPARAVGLGRDLGTLRPGAAGDVVVLEPDDLEVVLTAVGGRVVFSRLGP